MNTYNIYRETETEKYDAMRIVRMAGAMVTSVSGCGTGYYIQIDATEKQVETINKMIMQ